MRVNTIYGAKLKASPAKIFWAVLVLLALPVVLTAQENDQENMEAERSGLFADVGFGGGSNFVTREGGSDTGVNFLIGIESKIGGHINGNLSVFMLTHLNIFSLDTVTAFSEWVFAENDGRALLAICIPFSLFLDSQVFIGPGVMYHTSTKAPSFFIEGGLGFTSVQSLANDTYILGAGFFTGLGVEITDDLSCGVRAIWFPSFLHSRWTPSRDNYFTIAGFIYF